MGWVYIVMLNAQGQRPRALLTTNGIFQYTTSYPWYTLFVAQPPVLLHSWTKVGNMYGWCIVLNDITESAVTTAMHRLKMCVNCSWVTTCIAEAKLLLWRYSPVHNQSLYGTIARSIDAYVQYCKIVRKLLVVHTMRNWCAQYCVHMQYTYMCGRYLSIERHLWVGSGGCVLPAVWP